MSDAPNYPYATHLNVLYPPLEVVDVPALVAACTDPWYNQTLCRVNDSVVLGVAVLRKPCGEGFEIVFLPAPGVADADELQAATALNRVIEDCIALAPEQYQWMYKRFSKSPPGRDNPYVLPAA